ncbi:MAG: BatD family protein, partial [Alphaproteobacteria bacterium]|nr:BatD family protein [Alphaproteobacteria bacterium]
MKKYLFALFLGLYAIDCMAAVDAQISASQASIDDVLILTITSSDTSSAQPDLTPLRDMFEVVSSSVSHQASIINGRMSSQNIWKIGLKALQTGKLVIPPLTVGTQKTAPIDVVITNTPSAIAAPVQNSQAVAQTDSPLYALSAELKTDADPFIGEQMRYFVTLTDDGTIEDGAPSFEPTTDFIIKSLGNPQVQTLGNGKRQITFAFAIFSLKSGKVKIPTVYFKGYAYQKPDVDNVFGAGFFNIQMPSVFGLQTPVNLAFEGPEIDIRPAVADYH